MRIKYNPGNVGPTEGAVKLGLARTRGLVKRGWCQRLVAADENGHGVRYDSRRAAAWCVSGACSAAAVVDDEYDTKLRNAMSDVIGAAVEAWPGGGLNIPDWNDAKGRTQAEVLTLLEQAEMFVGVVL